MTRNGKIARLPQHIRQELNQRLQDGEPGTRLVEWLNGLPQVRQTLVEGFGGRPVSEQNLSEWKQGGYQDWLRHEESRLLVAGLTEQTDQLDEAADGQEISDRFAGMLSVELVALTRMLLEEKTDPAERWQCLREVLRELSQLRRDDHRAVRTLIKRDRWNRETEREDEKIEERFEKKRKDQHVDLFLAIHGKTGLAESLGGGEYGKKWADWLVRVQQGLSMPDWWRTDNRGSDSPDEIKPNPTESNQIKPEEAAPDGSESNPVKPGQTESNHR